MNIIASWKKSLSLFLPKNAKLFSLMIMRSIRDTYYLLWKHAKGTIMLTLAALGVGILVSLKGTSPISYTSSESPSFNDILITSLNGISYAVAGICSTLLFFYTVLFARSSIQKKDGGYLCEWRRKYIIPFFGAMLSVGLFIAAPLYTILYQFANPRFIVILGTIFSMIDYFFVFFFLDTIGGIDRTVVGAIKAWFFSLVQALKNSVKMVMYNLPIILLVYVINTSAIALFLMFPYNSNVLMALFSILFRPIFISLCGTLYAKYSYEQVALYTNGPKR